VPNKKKKIKLPIVFDEEITMIYIEFRDHAYNNGWCSPESYPTINASEQVACGVLVYEDADCYVIGTSVGKNVCKESALNPFLILKSTITNTPVTFTKEAFGNGKKR